MLVTVILSQVKDFVGHKRDNITVMCCFVLFMVLSYTISVV